jgi:hypothetical protein
LNFNDLRLVYCILKCYNLLNYFIHIDNFLHNFLCDDRFLNNKFNRNLLDKRNWNLAVFYGDFMNLYNLFYNSISEHFYWNLFYNLSWNSSLSLYYFWYLFLDNYLNNFISLSNFDILYNFYLGLVNIDIFDDFYLSYYWDFSDDLYDLQIGNFNSYYFLD